MKVLFVHDHRFTKVNNEVYSDGSFPKSIWNRYLSFFTHITVLGRKKISSDLSSLKMSVSSHYGVSFELLDYLESYHNFHLYRNKVKNDIRHIVCKHKIKAVIVRMPSNLGNLAIDVCEELRIPYAVEVVGCAYDAIYNYKFSPCYNVKNLGVKFLAPYSYKRMKSQVKNTSHAIYVTKEYLQNRYPTKINAITSGTSDVVIPDFNNDVLFNHIAFFSLKKKYLSLGMIGNLDVHYKGYDIALEALSLAKNQIPPFKLYLVGGGKGEKVKKDAERLGLLDHVVFVGQLKSGEDVFNYLDTLDIYLHPSRTEGMPRALIEAMGRGCPCLASSVGGIPELLEDRYLHMPEDYKTLSKQITDISNSKKLLIEAANKNFEKAKEYTFDVLNERRNKFWKSFYDFVVDFYNKHE